MNPPIDTEMAVLPPCNRPLHHGSMGEHLVSKYSESSSCLLAGSILLFGSRVFQISVSILLVLGTGCALCLVQTIVLNFCPIWNSGTSLWIAFFSEDHVPRHKWGEVADNLSFHTIQPLLDMNAQLRDPLDVFSHLSLWGNPRLRLEPRSRGTVTEFLGSISWLKSV